MECGIFEQKQKRNKKLRNELTYTSPSTLVTKVNVKVNVEYESTKHPGLNLQIANLNYERGRGGNFITEERGGCV